MVCPCTSGPLSLRMEKKETMATLTKEVSKDLKVSNGKVPNLARLATIPDKGLAAKYIGRSIGGIQDFDIFRLALRKHWNVLLEGDTGAGKTFAAQAFAASEGVHFYSTPSNVGIDPSQLLGKYIPDENGDSIGVWQDGPVTDMIRHGGVLLINEINFLPPRIATVLFSLLDARREIALLDHKGEVIKAHPDLLIIADMNPGYIGTQDLNAALRNRFELQIDWGYDPNVERTLIKSSSLLGFAARVRKSRNDAEMVTPTSTNMLEEFETLALEVGIKFAIANMVQHYDVEDREAVQAVLRTMESNFTSEYNTIKRNNEVGTAPAPAPKKEKKASGWDYIDEEVETWLTDLT